MIHFDYYKDIKDALRWSCTIRN